jgi:uncharacterized coiled-coil protein SlyX
MRWIQSLITTRIAAARRIEELEQRVRLQDDEIASLKRQLAGCHDTLDRHAWQQRALGAEAKVVAESMRQHGQTG